MYFSTLGLRPFFHVLLREMTINALKSMFRIYHKNRKHYISMHRLKTFWSGDEKSIKNLVILSKIWSLKTFPEKG